MDGYCKLHSDNPRKTLTPRRCSCSKACGKPHSTPTAHCEFHSRQPCPCRSRRSCRHPWWWRSYWVTCYKTLLRFSSNLISESLSSCKTIFIGAACACQHLLPSSCEIWWDGEDTLSKTRKLCIGHVSINSGDITYGSLQLDTGNSQPGPQSFHTQLQQTMQ